MGNFSERCLENSPRMTAGFVPSRCQGGQIWLFVAGWVDYLIIQILTIFGRLFVSLHKYPK